MGEWEKERKNGADRSDLRDAISFMIDVTSKMLLPNGSGPEIAAPLVIGGATVCLSSQTWLIGEPGRPESYLSGKPVSWPIKIER